MSNSKNFICHKPVRSKDRDILNKYDLCLLIFNTGARINEVRKLINEFQEGNNEIKITTKNSGTNKNIFKLNTAAYGAIQRLSNYKNKSTRTLSRAYKAISIESGVDFTAHNLRASFATDLGARGVHIQWIRHFMNHSSINQTVKYMFLDENEGEIILESLNSFDSFEGREIFELRDEIVLLRKKNIKLEDMLNKKKEGK